MINLTALCCGASFYGDSLRYSSPSRGAHAGTTSRQGPVVAWNCTRRCNQNCVHCYMEANSQGDEQELDSREARKFSDDLAAFGVPVLLLSGGEPLMREDFWDLAGHAIEKGIRVTISTNGTLITPSVARDMKKLGISYVGISLDGVEDTHDSFRDSPGAFNRTLESLRYCREAGQKVGLRFTLTRRNYRDLGEVLRLVEEEDIPRVCFYHLVFAGRGKDLKEEMIPHEVTREIINHLIESTERFYNQGKQKEILTVDNHADGVYLYLQLLRKDPDWAEQVRQMLEHNGGNRSGIAIGAVDPKGGVHPDQFSQDQLLGNIREKPFSRLWTQGTPLLHKLRQRKPYLKGRCGSCRWLSMCNGNLRARAYASCGDFWAEDPGCYLGSDLT